METLFFALFVITVAGLLIWSTYARNSTRKNQRYVRVDFVYQAKAFVVEVRILRLWCFVFVRLSVVPEQEKGKSPSVSCELFKNGKRLLLVPNFWSRYNGMTFARRRNRLNANIKLDSKIIFEIPLV